MMTLNDVYKVGGGLLVGAAVGGVTGMLLAPKAGKETREDIMEKANEVQEKTKAMFEETKERAGDMYDRSRQMIGDTRQRAMEAVDSGRDRVLDKAESMAHDAKKISQETETKTKHAKASAS